MSLLETKKLLNFDQQNIVICSVVNDFDTFATVRTDKGLIVRAGKTSGSFFEQGSNVEVRTDKKVYTIIGDSEYSEYSADRTFTI